MNKFNLELTEQQLSIINQAVINLPYHLAAPLIAEINKQISKQIASAGGSDNE